VFLFCRRFMCGSRAKATGFRNPRRILKYNFAVALFLRFASRVLVKAFLDGMVAVRA
jgi:hypothetical protein